MKHQPKIDWHEFPPIDTGRFQSSLAHFIKAAGYIAAVDKLFSKEDKKDKLTWIPGFQRLAGSWIQGEHLFRLSLGLEPYAIFIVDDKVNVLDSISLDSLTSGKLLLWLEEQIGKQGLNAADLEISNLEKTTFAPKEEIDGSACAAVLHNSFVTLREFKYHFSNSSDVLVDSFTLNQDLTLTIKDSGDAETNTLVKLGVQLRNEGHPYLFVKTQPFVSVEQMANGQDGWKWVEDDWTGASYSIDQLLSETGEVMAMSFYLQVTELLLKALKG